METSLRGRARTKFLPENYDYLAPDTTEIRLLLEVDEGGLAHATLPKGGVSLSVVHKTVEEIWYFIEGEGEIWRKQGDWEHMENASPGVCLTIPRGVTRQYRNIGAGPLRFLIATMPPWPGRDEAARVAENILSAMPLESRKELAEVRCTYCRQSITTQHPLRDTKELGVTHWKLDIKFLGVGQERSKIVGEYLCERTNRILLVPIASTT